MTAKPSEVKQVDIYKNCPITTRSGGRDGYRVMAPYGSGIIDFADSIEEAKKIIDDYSEGLPRHGE